MRTYETILERFDQLNKEGYEARSKLDWNENEIDPLSESQHETDLDTLSSSKLLRSQPALDAPDHYCSYCCI